MNVIIFESDAYYKLLNEILSRLEERKDLPEDKWISSEEAMHKLRIKSKTTLYKLRSEGKIRYSQPEKKLILYDSVSIDEYLESSAKDTF